MSSTPLMFRILNPMMEGLLKSPFHAALSGKIMVFSFTGRKSGRQYTTPVSYCFENGTVYCFTHANWWRNLEGGAPVQLRIRGRLLHGRAEPVVDDVERKTAGLKQLLTAVPWDAGFYGVHKDGEGALNEEDLRRGAEKATMIVTQLEET